jgi:hypothetical protein
MPRDDAMACLVDRLLQGDQSAEDELRRRIVPQIVRVVRRVVIFQAGESVLERWLRDEVLRRLLIASDHSSSVSPETIALDRRQAVECIAYRLSKEIIELLLEDERRRVAFDDSAPANARDTMCD